MAEKKFYFIQDDSKNGPFLMRQIKAMIRVGAIRADSTVYEENNAPFDVERFIETYGWSDEEDELGVALNQLAWLKKIGTIVIVAWLLVLLFGFKIYLMP